ncbi:outer kinetochore KNL1 complex subunit ZWINT isoform X2 [Sminthopsis crassicaudata]|uniref:outer kinetochore KNL1 complex subunit ZWINT isoform X2 n=1 Tax=Sminthopsis crassicaudata TaxID=9301 RepID=UPI003D696893
MASESVEAAAKASGKALASASAALAAPMAQEDDISSAMLADFLKDSRKKEKLLWSQLQVADALQGFLEHMDMMVDPEEEIRAEATTAQQLWKDLKAEHQKQVEAIETALPKALLQLETSQKKQALLERALGEAQAKRQILEEQKDLAQALQRHKQKVQRQKLVAETQAQRERLESAKREWEKMLAIQRERQESAQRLDTFLGLLEKLHEAEGDGGNRNLSGAAASHLQ